MLWSRTIYLIPEPGSDSESIILDPGDPQPFNDPRLHLERSGDSLAAALQVDEVVDPLLTLRHPALGQVQLPHLSAHLHKIGTIEVVIGYPLPASDLWHLIHISPTAFSSHPLLPVLWIRMRMFLGFPDRIRHYLYWSGSFHQQARKVRKTLISALFDFLT